MMDKKKAKLQDKINKVTAELIELRAELNYWERQKTLAMQEKVRGGNNHGH
jgi:hypothetical protein